MKVKTLIILAIIIICKAISISNETVTIVTGLWDIGRKQRPVKKFYLKYMQSLLYSQQNMIVFGQDWLKQFIFKFRNQSNTIFVQLKFPQDFHKFWYYTKLYQKNKKIFGVNHRLKDYIQVSNPYYNHLMNAKIYMIKQAAFQHDKWKSDSFIWIDSGIAHFEEKNILQNAKQRNVFAELMKICKQPTFFSSIPYKQDIVNFKTSNYMEESPYFRMYGGFFGIRKQAILTSVNIFQNFLQTTLNNNDIWSDQVLFYVMVHRYPYLMKHKSNPNLQSLLLINHSSIYRQETPQITRSFSYSISKSLIQKVVKQKLTLLDQNDELQELLVLNKQNTWIQILFGLIFSLICSVFAILVWRQGQKLIKLYQKYQDYNLPQNPFQIQGLEE